MLAAYCGDDAAIARRGLRDYIATMEEWETETGNRTPNYEAVYVIANARLFVLERLLGNASEAERYFVACTNTLNRKNAINNWPPRVYTAEDIAFMVATEDQKCVVGWRKKEGVGDRWRAMGVDNFDVVPGHYRRNVGIFSEALHIQKGGRFQHVIRATDGRQFDLSGTWILNPRMIRLKPYYQVPDRAEPSGSPVRMEFADFDIEGQSLVLDRGNGAGMPSVIYEADSR